MGSQRLRKPPWDMRKYNWIENDEYLTILGVPLGAPETLKPFWSRLADKIDARVAKLAPATNYMTIFGRASVVNFIIYGIPRYWLQTLAAPKWFHTRVQKAVDAVLWTSPYTNKQSKWIKHPHYPISHGKSATRTLGLGLLNWPSHVKALQTKWILNYLNARKALWKHGLDAWVCRTGLGRGAVLSTIPTKVLTGSIRGNPALPVFWKEAIANFRKLDIQPSFLTREGALSQPIWHNPHIPPPGVRAPWARLWEALHTNVIHNVFKDGAFLTPYSKEECSAYLEHLPGTFVHEGRSIHKKEFLDSWDEIVSHATRVIGRSQERPCIDKCQPASSTFAPFYLWSPTDTYSLGLTAVVGPVYLVSGGITHLDGSWIVENGHAPRARSRFEV